jgi:hypothetical protein
MAMARQQRHHTLPAPAGMHRAVNENEVSHGRGYPNSWRRVARGKLELLAPAILHYEISFKRTFHNCLSS